jgi:hypothetical protein
VLSPTDRRVEAVLRRSLIVQVATLSPWRRPFLTPLWFVVDAGVLYMTTGPGTRAARNVVAHPEVTLLFSPERGDPCDRLLRLHGIATVEHGLPSWGVLARVAAKYYLAPGALAVEVRHVHLWRLRQRMYGQVKGGFGHLRVVPSGAEFLPRP